MSDVKVVAVSGPAAEQLLAAITKLLGGQAETPVETLAPVAEEVELVEAVDEVDEVEDDNCGDENCSFCNPDYEEEVEEEPVPVNPTIISDDENEQRYKRSYSLDGTSDDALVTVTKAGVEVRVGEWTDLIAPQGAFDEVTATQDEQNVLTVRLYKLSEDGREVEVDYV